MPSVPSFEDLPRSPRHDETTRRDEVVLLKSDGPKRKSVEDFASDINELGVDLIEETIKVTTQEGSFVSWNDISSNVSENLAGDIIFDHDILVNESVRVISTGDHLDLKSTDNNDTRILRFRDQNDALVGEFTVRNLNGSGGGFLDIEGWDNIEISPLTKFQGDIEVQDSVRIISAGDHIDVKPDDNTDTRFFKFRDSNDNLIGKFTARSLDGVGAGILDIGGWDNIEVAPLAKFESGVELVGTDGMTISPGSDQDTPIAKVNVTGSPEIGWDSSEDAFVLNKGLFVNESGLALVEVDSGVGSDSEIRLSQDGVDKGMVAFDDSLNVLRMFDYVNSTEFLKWDLGSEELIFAQGLTSSANIDLNASLISSGDLKDDEFASGWIAAGGKGYGIYQDGSATDQWNAEFNDLLVRGSLKVFELIVKQISALGGTEILSIGLGEVESLVSGSAGSEVLEIEDPSGVGATSFRKGDLIIVQEFDINDPANLVKQEFRVVERVGTGDGLANNNRIKLVTDSNAPAPGVTIGSGDLVVVYGNIGSGTQISGYTTASASVDTGVDGRDNIIYRNVDGSSDSVINRLQEGVSSYSDFNSPVATTRFAYGDLNGFADYSSEAWGVFIGDDSADKVTVDAGNGIRFLGAGNNVAAQLSGDLFKIGDSTNYVEYNSNTSAWDMRVEKFTLSALSNGTGLEILSSEPSVKMPVSGKTNPPIIVGPNESTPSTVPQIGTTNTIPNSGTIQSPTTLWTSDSQSVQNQEEGIEITFDYQGWREDKPANDIRIAIEGYNGSDWLELHSKERTNLTNNNSITESIATNSGQFQSVRLIVHFINVDDIAGTDFNFAVSNINVKEYESRMVLNDEGLFQRNSPNQLFKFGAGSVASVASVVQLPQPLDTSDSPTFAGLTSSGRVTLNHTLTQLLFVETDAVANNGKWLVGAQSGEFVFLSRNDDLSPIGKALALDHGTLHATFGAGLTINGDVDISGLLTAQGGIASGNFTVSNGVPEIDLDGSRIVFQGDSSNLRDWAYWEHSGTQIWKGWLQSGGNLRFEDIQFGNDFLIDLNGGGLGVGIGTNAVSAGVIAEFGGDVTADNFILSSDRRIKEDIQGICCGLGILRELKPRTFVKKGQFDTGFIAQEVLDVYPKIVRGSEEDGYKLSAMSFTALNASAIKELDRNQMTLKERVKHLEKQVVELGGAPYANS